MKIALEILQHPDTYLHICELDETWKENGKLIHTFNVVNKTTNFNQSIAYEEYLEISRTHGMALYKQKCVMSIKVRIFKLRQPTPMEMIEELNSIMPRN